MSPAIMPSSPFWSLAMSPAKPCAVRFQQRGVERLELLREQCRDHAGQNVPRTPFRHAGIPRAVDRQAFAVGDDRSSAFENQSDVFKLPRETDRERLRAAWTSAVVRPVRRANSPG